MRQFIQDLLGAYLWPTLLVVFLIGVATGGIIEMNTHECSISAQEPYVATCYLGGSKVRVIPYTRRLSAPPDNSTTFYSRDNTSVTLVGASCTITKRTQ